MPTTEKSRPLSSSLRALALTPSSAFRTKVVDVPEWDGAKVMLREPSGEAWMRFREVMNPEVTDGDEQKKLTALENFMRNKEADVVMLIDVLLDENGDRVFSEDDQETVSKIYGPVHTRLLNQALKLGMSQEIAGEK